MNSESVHLIATDPPFNKNRDFHATPDSLSSGASFQDRWSWDRDVHQEWVDKITDDFPELMEAIESARNAHSDGMGAFVCFMAVRLLEMKRILRKDGSIYLHCDPTASHYIKAIMDAIFGYKNFVNEIVWKYNTGGASKKSFSKKHDIILFYSKTKNKIFNPQYEPYREEKSNHFDKVDKDGRAYRIRKIDSKEYKYYLDRGRICHDTWIIDSLNAVAKERIGYPTQKPPALYERIIKASSNEGDIVLDPFCGCGTTLVASEKLNRQWVGIDIWDKAKDVILGLFEKQGLIVKGRKKGYSGTQHQLFRKNITWTSDLPVRTDKGEEAVPFLKTKLKIDEPKGHKMTRAEMLKYLLDQEESKCQGCNRQFDDPRYLELDHNTPRSDGGLNHISNRILLCGPCNKLKSNKFTLSGLIKENKRLGYCK